LASGYDAAAELALSAGRHSFERAGFVVIRIAGSHYQMFDERTRRHTTVPRHNRDLPRGTVAAIIQQAGLTGERFPQVALMTQSEKVL
jgi:predicted RNA binding protein YcfA (HicA-like mRNA interferase family)